MVALDGGGEQTGGATRSPFMDVYAAYARAYMERSGATVNDFAQVAVKSHDHAALNPKAKNREPITVQDVLDSRPVVWPFNVLNICLVTDAGGAVVMTRADRARDCAKKPVYVRGAGEGVEHVMLTQMRSLSTSEATRLSGEKAFAMAGFLSVALWLFVRAARGRLVAR